MAPIFIVIIFVAVVFAVEGLYFLLLERRAESSTVRRRLRALGSTFQAGGVAREDSILRGEGGSSLGQLLSAVPKLDGLRLLLYRAGWTIRPERFVLLSVGVGVGAWFFGSTFVGDPYRALPLLARADTLYEQGKTRQAAALFAKHDSLEAKVGAAFASWPEGSLDRLEQLGKLYPEEAVVQLHLGLARLWANEGDPLAAWRAAAEAEPDTPYAILAGNVLYPKVPRGLPTFIPSFEAPAAVTKLPPGPASQRTASAMSSGTPARLTRVALTRVW